MKLVFGVFGMSLLLALTACAQDSSRPTEDSAKRMLAERCPAGYVEYPAGSGYCEPYDPRLQQRATPVRDTVGGVMSQPAPIGGLHR